MANFDAQIQDLVGTFSDQDAMDQWMMDGVREIINILPPHLKEACYSKQTFTSAAANSESETILTNQIGSVFAGSVEARRIRPMDKHKAADSGSVEYASATDPVYYVEGGKINILPASSSGVYYVIANPSIDASAVSTISNFPNEAEYLVVLYASVKALQRLMNDTRSSLPSDVSSITLATTSTSLPSYTAPSSFVLPAPPAGADVDNLPSIPVPPSLSSNSISFSTSAPTYTGPVVAPDFSDANTWLNTEEDSEMVSSRIQVINAQMQEYSAKVQDAVNRFNKENVEYQAQLQISTQDAQLSQTDDSQKLQKYQAELSSYNAELSKALQVYQAETGYDMSKYQADIQANLQKYQSDLSKEQSSFNSNLQKYQAEASKVSSDNQITISKFGQDVSNYNAKIQKLLTDYQWYQSQYAQLKQDYQQGIQILSGGGMSQAQKGGK
tara:strand:+ start:932 stop:2257 length:1326 start_codon:yes stop_codon:yes gene_type:complete